MSIGIHTRPSSPATPTMTASAAQRPAAAPRRRRKLRRNAKDAGLLVIIAIVLLAIVFPFLWMVLTSLRKPTDILQKLSMSRLFSGLSMINFHDLFAQSDFGRYIVNSIIVCGAAMIITVILASAAAFAMSRYSFRGRGAILAAILATQLFPFVILITPMYSMFADLGLLNSYAGLTIAYVGMTLPFSIYLMLGFLDTIPVSLDEAARVDGCNTRQVISRVVFPLALPAVATVGAYAFIQGWEELLFAQTMMTNSAMKTVQVGLASFFGEYTTNWGIVMAASVVSALPTMVLFFAIQRKLVSGLAAGGIKE